MADVMQNDFGYPIRMNVTADLSDTTSLLLRIQPPSGPAQQRAIPTSNIVTANPGVILYLVAEGDFILPGTYQLQVVDNTTGRRLSSKRIKIKVLPSI